MYINIPEQEINKAISFLIENLPYNTFHRYDVDNPSWWVTEHFGLGTDVRNLLRHGGFNWDDVTLDGLWYELFEKAARRINGK